jgi:hypothetical protein
MIVVTSTPSPNVAGSANTQRPRTAQVAEILRHDDRSRR